MVTVLPVPRVRVSARPWRFCSVGPVRTSQTRESDAVAREGTRKSKVFIGKEVFRRARGTDPL